ncbi:cupin-like domain-containing protein [Aliiglaciecola sp. LCG003]|uniref:cupin-like domain-containing protein n=1 Tax=Aliiglaciecola sp. LCG003 TaxID=3053655 RepID=UPI00257341CA|nr:cupin-like domain-containing protein [Aliiglaciecola sp. LCG003]WJG09738.1 cupin-like domain-containing protein [Aliiglaciecola sp. LCG003]
MSQTQNNLAEGWGSKPVTFSRDWMDLSLLPTNLTEIEKLLRQMPSSRVFVRITSPDLADSNIQRLALEEVPNLVEVLEKGEGTIHLQAIQLDEYLDVYAAFKTAFIEKVAQAVPEFNHSKLISSSVGLFISTPGATAPFHADPEHNFLLQVSGDKTMHSFPPRDFETFPTDAREALAAEKVSILKTYQAKFEDRATILKLSEGDFIYHPPMSPHWVKTGSEGYGLSYTISLVTEDVEQTLLLHKLNRKLRKFGITPSQQGSHPFIDNIKIKSADFSRKIKRKFF